MKITTINKFLSIWLFSILIFHSAYSSEISLENENGFDIYNLYYNSYSLKFTNISSPVGNFAVEAFYDNYGLSKRFNGINKFSDNLFGSRLFYNNNWNKLYYYFGIGNDNFQNFEENLFYEMALAYLIPIDSSNSIVLIGKANRYRSKMNPLSTYLGVANQTISFHTQFKLSFAYIEASFLTNNLSGVDVNKNMLVQKELITEIPKNKQTSFYLYAYKEIFKSISAGLAYGYTDSEINVYQPTLISPEKNYYTYFPYFTPIKSNALSLLLIADHNINIGSIDFGKISFKTTIPIISSTSLLYEVAQGEIAPSDYNVYYDYSGVEPLKIEIFYNKKFEANGLSFVVGFTYFDKPYLKNAYFSSNENGYKNHQLTIKIIKSL
jgi:hypothetical protein